MNQRWNLDALYASFDSQEFQNDFASIDKLVEETQNWVETRLNGNLSKEEKQRNLEDIIKRENILAHRFSRLFSYASLVTATEANNNTAYAYLEKIQRKIVDLTSSQIRVKQWIAEMEDLHDIVDRSPLLQEHRFFLDEICSHYAYQLSDREEMIIAKMKNTGSDAWSKLQNVQSANLMVDIDIDGEKKSLPLPVVRNMSQHKEQKIRKAAYEAELAAYKKIELSAASCLNAIKGEVLAECELRGFDDPIDMTLLDSRMDKATLQAMLQAMKDSLPSFHKYLKRKAELLGHTDSLPFYDINAPVGQADLHFTYREARDFIVQNFTSFSQELSDFAAHAFDNEWIDAEPREGKRGGAFCSNLHVIGQSRILSNFTGSLSDVGTLAHELGHGFHGHCLKNSTALNASYPMPLAETASIFCETIVNNAIIRDSKKEEALTILEERISGALAVIVDIYSRYLFETELFRRRRDSALSVEELKEIMLDAQKQAYGSALDEDVRHPYMWLNKPHYYYAKRNFYNFPYAFGLLFATGLYAEYQKQGEAFIPQYSEILKATGCHSIADVLKIIHIDSSSLEFWKSSLSVIEADIEKFLQLSNEV